ncbi:MAG: wax ester synthase/diacylglycerol acyltransferase [Ilumatobacteraceae bacterium]|nr:wax ester synthase/diacylglycerol acyltransferase [Ilumatobacteraceae bacterium]
MRQLSGIDVSFLNMETSSVFGHVSSLNIFDPTGAPGGAGVEATKQLILERIDQLAPFRRRLVEVPFGLDLPYWIEDPAFDIDFHVRHHAVPAPGTPEQLAEVISRIVARPLDRTRPLWELYVIEGVAGGTRIAQLTKVHHAAIDGAAGASMLAAVLDPSPDFRPTGTVAPWVPDAVPSDEQLLRITALQYLRRPEKVIRLSVRSMRELAAATQNGGLRALADIVAQPMPGALGRVMRERLRGANHDVDNPPALPPTHAPRTPWNRPITPHRRFTACTVPLDDAKRVRRQFGCTFNDVVMALCSGTLRRYLLLHDCLPDEALIAMVPISVRSGSEADTYQNRVSALLADLATNEADPVARLRRVRASMNAAKENFAAIPAETLQDFTQFAPPAVAARAMRMYSRLRIADRMNPPFNLIISNVPGPSTPLYSAGARLEHFYPVSALADGQGLNMTVQSYNGNLDFGFIACRDLVPDLAVMPALLAESMAELLALCDPVEVEVEVAATAARAPARQRRAPRAATAPLAPPKPVKLPAGPKPPTANAAPTAAAKGKAKTPPSARAGVTTAKVKPSKPSKPSKPKPKPAGAKSSKPAGAKPRTP